jgi:DNA-binding NarL/FixJ family response regulator
MAASPEPAAGPVLIVDDHELVATSLMLSLRSQGIPAHHCAPTDGEEGVLAASAELPPGLVLLDLDLGRDGAGRRIDGVALVAPLRAAGWRVAILTGSADHARIGAALAEGAVAWVPKNAPLPALLVAVRDAMAGREVMPPARREQFIELYRRRSGEQNELRAKLERLTPREREVLALLANGQRAQAVADHFVVSLATVRTQIRAVLMKLEVGSQLEAVAAYRKAARG